MSLRNPLLNYRSLRARGVEIVGESAAQVFDTLVSQGTAMSFLAKWDDDDEPDEADPDSEWASTGLPKYRPANQTDRRLQTAESSLNLQKRLLNTYRLANSTIEETGVNTLFLALGMLQWYEADQSGQERRAPLILVPVRLERSGVREQFRALSTGEDIGANLSLVEKTRADFGLLLPGQDEVERIADGSIDLVDYYDMVEERIRQFGLQRWSVDPNRIALGFFSYNKILMYRDLDVDVWPEADRIEENEIMSALFRDGFTEPAPAIPGDAHIDGHLSPQDTYHVLDADSSQSLAIHDANGGRNLVIQGPPGTGKSQTITNIIAEAVGRGKRVLFVAEKMAALEVVKRRLDNIGLGDACLELHSHKTNKRQTLDNLGRILKLGNTADNGDGSVLDDLARTRSQLNDYAEAINTPVGASGVTPYDAFGYLLTLDLTANEKRYPNPVSWKQISGPDSRMMDWTGADFNRKREVVEELRLRLKRAGVPRQHPFYGCRLRSLLPADQASLPETIDATACALEAMADSSDSLAAVLALNSPGGAAEVDSLLDTARQVAAAPDVSGLDLAAPQCFSDSGQIREWLDKGLAWRRIRSEYDASLLPQAWDADLHQVHHVLDTTGRSFFGRLFSSGYRRARKQLAAVLTGEFPRDVNRQIVLINAISEEQQLRAELGLDESRGKHPGAQVLSSRWAGYNTNWDAVVPVVRWWLNLCDEVTSGRVSLDVVRSLQGRANTNRLHTEVDRNIDETSRALDAYLNCARELQSMLDMDGRARFDNPDGLISLSFSAQRSVLSDWASHLPEIQGIIGFNNGADAALAEGLSPVAVVAEQDLEAATLLTVWFERAWYESIVETAFAKRNPLRDFDGQVHEGRIERFQTLDRQSLGRNRARVGIAHRSAASKLNQLTEQLVRLRGEDDSESARALIRQRQEQLRTLRREIEKKRRHKPIRQLLEKAGDVIQELKPVFMMSPLSIATYLAPGSVKFDLAVFDEASQVRPVDALGALLRVEKAVIVGDSKQLPPTSFFDRVAQSDDGDGEEEESVVSGIESILRLFSSRGAPERQLRWHYRSRHESLIAVSNQEFYDNNLIVFPSPDIGREAAGLQFRYLPSTVFDRGRSAANRLEADAVAQAVMEHAASSPELSLGVAAFSLAQSQAIQDQLEALRRRDDSVEDFFAAHPDEPFFVKNLENVQGDERDVIFISVGYGRDETGHVAMHFGPLNYEGGERRLNVLITRAKRQCHVFTNLRADDIDLGRAKSFGVRALKTFLAYAETGVMPRDVPYESDFVVDSPFQHAVAARLKERGYLIHQEVASGGKFIDIGVVDPEQLGRYILGIECDGAAYHSARSARDRDRLRETVLEGLGWKLHRIWSTDWFQHPERELERAVQAIEKAQLSLERERPNSCELAYRLGAQTTPVLPRLDRRTHSPQPVIRRDEKEETAAP